MCDRDGAFYRNASRRGFLRASTAAGATLALPPSIAALLAPGSAAAATGIKATHGSGFCNMGIFLAKERQLAKADGVDIEFVVTPSNADIATLFGSFVSGTNLVVDGALTRGVQI